jgi:hypothetical protein
VISLPVQAPPQIIERGLADSCMFIYNFNNERMYNKVKYYGIPYIRGFYLLLFRILQISIAASKGMMKSYILIRLAFRQIFSNLKVYALKLR